MKFFYEKFWVPVFGYIVSKFVFLIEGKKQESKNKIKEFILETFNIFIARLLMCQFVKNHLKSF